MYFSYFLSTRKSIAELVRWRSRKARNTFHSPVCCFHTRLLL